MSGRKVGVLCLVLVGLLVPALRADVTADVEARLRQDLKFLTSDACEGRGITTKGIELAAEHVAREFQKAGLKPGGPDGTYFQTFPLFTGAKAGPNNHLILKGPLGQTVALAADKHFNPSGLTALGQVDAELIFAGHGITSDEPKYDDYAGLDVAGKIVLVLDGAPRRGHRYADPFTTEGRPHPQASVRAKVENAQRRKAVAVIVVGGGTPGFAGRGPGGRFGGPAGVQRVTATMRDGSAYTLPVAHLRRDELDPILFSVAGAYLAQLEHQIGADLKPRGLPLRGWTGRLQTDVTRAQIMVKNIIGVLDGAGPLAKETVVVGAHYDHVGYGARGPGSFGGASGRGGPGGVGATPPASTNAIHRGADDNASGTTALMEVARRFGKDTNRAGRRLVFIAFTAEESGLLGSAHYCRQPVFPLADTVAMVNMDMVGRLQDNKLMIGGLSSATQFQGLIEELNKKHDFNVWKEPSGQGPSDHASFYAMKIPVFKFFTGFHEQYHRPTDRMETINVPGLRRIAALVGDVTGELRGISVRPEYAKTGGFNRNTTLWAGTPSVGVLPDYADAKGGVLLEGVVSGSPAEKAGLKKGDRLTMLAGQPVKNAESFLAQARTLKAGAKIEATVEREGKPQKVEIQLARGPAALPDPRFGYRADFTDMKDGLLLTDVPADSAAAKAGLRKGDRILAIDGETFADQLSYIRHATNYETGDVAVMTVARDGKEIKVSVTATLRPRGGPGKRP